MLRVAQANRNGESASATGDDDGPAPAAVEHMIVGGDEVVGDEEAAAEAASVQRDEHNRGDSQLSDPARIDSLRGIGLLLAATGLRRGEAAS